MRSRYLVLASLSSAIAAGGFDWPAITPSEQLQYHACYDGLQCARLLVPLDWLDANNTKKVAIAITTLPAKVPSDHPSFGGTIVLNPGGPGGSGISFVQRIGHRLQAMTEGKKHYEFLGFDPRGVAYTTPRVDCFGEDHAFARDSLILESRGIGGMDASVNGLRRFLALDDAFGELCAAKDVDGDILPYVSTASVARDIIEIADRAEDLRHNQHAAQQESTQHPMEAGKELPERTPARVMFWGFSYGTVLGNTLASMFPGRVARIVLDGVDDVHDYYSGTWKRNILDADKIVDYFYDTCFDGATNCALWKKGDTSGKDIKKRIDKLISDADINPIGFVQSDGTSNVGVITGNDIRHLFMSPLYRPLPTGFDDLANALAETLEGNYTLISREFGVPPLQDACSIDNSTDPLTDDATTAILCSDADFADPDGPHHEHRRLGLRYWQDYVGVLKNQSQILGPAWSEVASRCTGWRARPKWRFTGPFTTPPADPSLKEGIPAAPILFASTRLDPVTPLSSAYSISSEHPGSAVLIHDSVGHTATTNAWTECFNKAIRDYFDDGIMPKNGTVCDTTCKPFSKHGKCQPPADVVAAASSNLSFDVVIDRRPGWSFKPLGVH